MDLFVIFYFASAIISLVLFLLYLDCGKSNNDKKTLWSRLEQMRDEGIFKNKPAPLSKDVIFAMMQRGIYSLDTDVETYNDGGEVHRWTRELLENSRYKLEENQPNILSYKNMANNFLENVEKEIEEFEDNLCKLNNDLEQIIEAHQSIKREIDKQLCQGTEKNVVVRDDCNRSWIPPVSSFQCPIIVDSQGEDNFLATLDRFEKERGIA
ncbi:uncharacterized protein LOC113557958 [Rhopalosiphum maidis]|uniref:uncharacterized protein LOC113557958 n=1 Tax=Rhopalosiphum maidis TaxID=43146 RepID=UPI000EFE3DDF|nr:uncharacterized protein LOC113557958 [Rhopalosiphum maidis]